MFRRYQIPDDLWAYQPCKIICSIIQTCYHKHGQVPSREELIILIADLGVTRKWTALMHEGVISDLDTMLKLEVSVITEEHFRTFLIKRDVHRVGEKLTGWDNSTSLDVLSEIRSQIDKIQAFGSDWEEVDDLGIFPFASAVLADPYSYLQELQDFARRVPFYCAKVLTDLLEGGLRPGELAIILGATGLGKSLVMLNLAAALTINTNRRCLYFAMDNTKAEMLERIWATVSGYPIASIPHMSNREPWKEAIVKGVHGPNTRFLLKQIPPGMATIDYLQRHIKRAKEFWDREDELLGNPFEDRDLALVVFDYAECIKPTRQREHYRFELQDISRELAGMAQIEDFAGLTGSQANRNALKKANTDLENFSESYSQGFIASIIMALCQQDHERALNQFRISLVKARRTGNRHQVYMEVDYQTLRIQDRLDANGMPLQAVALGSQQNDAGMTPQTRSSTSSSTHLDYSKLKGEFGDREPTEFQDMQFALKMETGHGPHQHSAKGAGTTSATPLPAEVAKKRRQVGRR